MKLSNSNEMAWWRVLVYISELQTDGNEKQKPSFSLWVHVIETKWCGFWDTRPLTASIALGSLCRWKYWGLGTQREALEISKPVLYSESEEVLSPSHCELEPKLAFSSVLSLLRKCTPPTPPLDYCSGQCKEKITCLELRAAQNDLLSCPGVKMPFLPQQCVPLFSCAWGSISSSIIHSARISSSFINLESNKIINFS